MYHHCGLTHGNPVQLWVVSLVVVTVESVSGNFKWCACPRLHLLWVSGQWSPWQAALSQCWGHCMRRKLLHLWEPKDKHVRVMGLGYYHRGNAYLQDFCQLPHYLQLILSQLKLSQSQVTISHDHIDSFIVSNHKFSHIICWIPPKSNILWHQSFFHSQLLQHCMPLRVYFCCQIHHLVGKLPQLYMVSCQWYICWNGIRWDVFLL